jgi:hypothetical protein
MRLAVLAAIAPLFVGSYALSQATSADKCVQTSQMRVYSSANISEETGDVVGYELAIKRHDDSAVDALLYVYEGAPNDEGIPLSGNISGKELAIEGNWVQHLVEYPSKREIIQTQFVKIDGTLDSSSFQGKLEIEGIGAKEEVRLKRRERIWVCRTSDRKKP